MKKLLLIIVLFFCLACSSIKEYSFAPNYQFWKESENPQLIIDSISNADTLSLLGNFKDWTKIEYFTSDSVIQKSYYMYNDSLKFSISVTEDINNKYSVKYIK